MAVDWSILLSTFIIPAIGFVLGGIFTYLLQYLFNRKQKNDEQKAELYNKIYDEFYQLECAFSSGRLIELKETELILQKGSAIFRLGNMEPSIRKILNKYESFRDELIAFDMALRDVVHQYVPDPGQYVDEEIGYLGVPYSIPTEIAFGFLEANHPTLETSVSTYVKKANETFIGSIDFGETDNINAEPSKNEIAKFMRIFDDRILIEKSQIMNSNYKELKTLIEEAKKKMKSHI